MTLKKRYFYGHALLLIFLFLAVNVMLQTSWLTRMDHQLQTQLATTSTINITIFKTIAFLGSPATVMVLTAILCGYLWFYRSPAYSIWIATIQLTGAGIVEVIKYIVQRARPLHQIVPDTGFSFPSGHTFCTTIFICTLLMVGLPLIKDQEKQLAVTLMAIVWLLMVAASRIVLRDHFPSDVLGSLLMAGAFWLLFIPQEAFILGIMKRQLFKGWSSKL
ncbi:MAG: phosphatase PAP2 family protein [Lactobacillus sp.]|jgi:undecaprenyl-diphosphatase|nr:phosphatase PAP2 family protein [Lactobacillus sp.]